MMRNKSFCVFIPTHKRADNVKTAKSLRKHGYTGKIYYVVDDEDEQLGKYKENFGDDVLVFSKDEIAPRIDRLNNFDIRNTVLFAREAIQIMAKDVVKVKNYIVLDDDYHQFVYMFTPKGEFTHKSIKNLDKVLDIMIDFLRNTNSTVLTMAQGGDFIGGAKGGYGSKIKLARKIMNTFVCDSDKPYKYYGAMNDDVNCYIYNGNIGMLLFMTNLVSINQEITQANKGGLTDMYLTYGTYVKSFGSVMLRPSSVKIAQLGQTHKRIHHKISYIHTCPRIIPESVKKK